MNIYDNLKDRLEEIISEHKISYNEKIIIKKLTPKEAIGETERKDYPILKGKELLINAYYKESIGQAFTNTPEEFEGSIKDVLELDLSNEKNIPIFIGTLNAILKDLGLIEKTIHCKDREPKICSEEILKYFMENYKGRKVVLVGLQPSMLEVLSREFNIRVLDLDPSNIGCEKFGVIIEDGVKDYRDVISWGDVFLVTGSCCSNKTLNDFILNKEVYFYGTTIAGIAYLMNLKRICFCGK